MDNISIFLRDFLYTLPRNTLRSFQGRNLLWHILAISITAVFVLSGFDWIYFNATHPFPKFLVAAVIIGWVVPIALPVILFITGIFKKNRHAICGAFSVAQAVIISLLISYFYKTFTGRPSPNALLIPVDNSKKFRFGFFRGHILPGWPSTHTTIAFSIAAAIWILYPNSKTARRLALFYVLFVAIGVSVAAHWLSDVIAGAIIGTVIGKTIGQSFKKTSYCNIK